MKKKLRREGSALLMVLGIMTVATMTLAMLHKMTSQQVHSTIITKNKLKARMIAESGLNLAYHMVRSDFKKLEEFKLVDKFSDGEYIVTSKTFSGELENRAQLTSIGTCGISKAVVAADLENFPIGGSSSSGDDDTSYEMDFDMLTGGPISVGAAFHADVDSVHANGTIEIQKDSTFDDSVTISSAQEVIPPKKDPLPPNVTAESNQPAQEVYPEKLQAAVQTFIDFARDNGAVYSDGSDIPHDPPGGVVIYTGPDKLVLNGGTYNGTIIVLGGSIVINGNVNFNGPDNYPSLISLSPDEIRINGTATMKGAVVAPNSEMVFLGTGTIYGSLVVGQGITGSGTANLYAGSTQGFSLPQEEDASTDKVVITAWH